MRDKLVHDYNKVDLDLTWEVTQSSIPELLAFVLPLLPQEETDYDSWACLARHYSFTDEELDDPKSYNHW